MEAAARVPGVLRSEVDGGQASRLPAADFLSRVAGSQFRRADVEILAQPELRPLVDVRGLGHHQGQIPAEAGEAVMVFAGHFAKRLACGIEVVPGRYHLGAGTIETGLRLLDIRRRDEADLESLTALFELLAERLFRSPGEGQLFRRPQDAEVGPGRAHHEVLARRCVAQVRLLDEEVGLAQGDPQGSAVDGLVQLEPDDVAVLVSRR